METRNINMKDFMDQLYELIRLEKSREEDPYVNIRFYQLLGNICEDIYYLQTNVDYTKDEIIGAFNSIFDVSGNDFLLRCIAYSHICPLAFLAYILRERKIRFDPCILGETWNRISSLQSIALG